MRACCLRAGLCVRVCISRWVRVTPCAGVCRAARPGHPGSLATLGSRCPVPGPDLWWCPAWLIACCLACLLGGSEGGCGGRGGGGRGGGMGSGERPRGPRSPRGPPTRPPAGAGCLLPRGCVRACVCQLPGLPASCPAIGGQGAAVWGAPSKPGHEGHPSSPLQRRRRQQRLPSCGRRAGGGECGGAG